MSIFGPDLPVMVLLPVQFPLDHGSLPFPDLQAAAEVLINP